jgi:hypothetical protein
VEGQKSAVFGFIFGQVFDSGVIDPGHRVRLEKGKLEDRLFKFH